MSLLSALGYVGDSLDKLGGRAIRGALGGHPNELASVVPFSDRIGLTDPKEIVSGHDLVADKGDQSLGSHLLGMGAEIALDPSDWVLGGLAKHLVGKAGRFANKIDDVASIGHLSDPAIYRHSASPTKHMAVEPFGGSYGPDITRDIVAHGPRYGDDTSKIREIFWPHANSSAIPDKLGRLPDLSSVLHEIPQGSKVIGGGAEALALKPEAGHIIRVGKKKPWEHLSAMASHVGVRPVAPEILQPARTVGFGGDRGLTVEHLPEVFPLVHPNIRSDLSDMRGPAWARTSAHNALQELYRIASQIGSGFEAPLNARGLTGWDVASNRSNVSLTKEGNAIIHDGGAVDSLLTGGRDEHLLRPLPDLGSPRNPVPEGSADEVRRAIQAGLTTQGQGVPLPDLGVTTSPADIAGMQQEIAELLSRYHPSFQQTLIAPGSDSGALADLFARAARSPQRPASGGDDLLRGLLGGFSDPSLAQGKKLGEYFPETGKRALYEGATPTTARHEAGHAMVDKAVKGGARKVAGLPLAYQPGGWLKYAAGNPQSGIGKLGRFVDEIAQHGTENRGLLNQLRGSFDFATDPKAVAQYAQHYQAGPILNAIMQAAPFARENKVPLALAAGLSAGDLGRIISQLEEARQSE